MLECDHKTGGGLCRHAHGPLACDISHCPPGVLVKIDGRLAYPLGHIAVSVVNGDTLRAPILGIPTTGAAG